jgi:hypothetical protein
MRSLFERLKYALYLAAVGRALIGLLVSLATADVIGLLTVAVFDMMFSPLYFVVLYVVAFIAAPWSCGAAADYVGLHLAKGLKMTPNHAVNTDAHRRRCGPWWSPVTLVR